MSKEEIDITKIAIHFSKNEIMISKLSKDESIEKSIKVFALNDEYERLISKNKELQSQLDKELEIKEKIRNDFTRFLEGMEKAIVLKKADIKRIINSSHYKFKIEKERDLVRQNNMLIEYEAKASVYRYIIRNLSLIESSDKE